MKRIALLFSMLAVAAFAQADKPTDDKNVPVSVTAKGTEVRTVLSSIFEQAKKQYVMDPDLHFPVYLSLDGVGFQRALDIVCNLASLHTDFEDGVYFVHPGKKKPVHPAPAVAPTAKLIEETIKVVPAPAAPPVVKPLGPLPVAVLARRVNTRLAKTDLRAVFDELGKQAHVTINVDTTVPAYKLDVFLINTTLKYALNEVTQAAGLEWKLPANHTISIVPQESSRVAVVKG